MELVATNGLAFHFMHVMQTCKLQTCQDHAEKNTVEGPLGHLS